MSGNPIISTLVCVLLLSQSFGQHAQTDTSRVETEQAEEVHWMTFEEALEASETEPKKWMIDLWTDWCGWCKRMDATTFKDSLIIDYLNDHFYPVSFDAEQKEDIVVGDKTYTFVAEGRRGYHELAATLMNGKMSYPTCVFLSPQLQNLSPVSGYQPPRDFMQILEFIVEFDPENNPITWEDFSDSYVSPYGPEE